MYQCFENIVIEGISACVPKNVIKNDHFNDLIAGKELRMFEKTVGIIERRWTENDVTASDLGFVAASKLLQGNFDRNDIKALIFISQTPDYKIPFTSNILQSRLGLENDMLCIDVNAGCSGFISGLSQAYAIAASLEKGKVLLIIADTLSKVLASRDRGSTMLFGDGASALIISKNKSANNKSFFNFFSDGINHQSIEIPDGGFRNQVSQSSFDIVERESGNFRSEVNLKMDGQKVFDFTLREISPSIIDLLAHFKIEKNNIDFFFFHQSNRFIIKQIAHQLGISEERIPININLFGNTSGVSLPLLLVSNELVQEKSFTALFSGYGAGLSWGNAVINVDENLIKPPLIEF